MLDDPDAWYFMDQEEEDYALAVNVNMSLSNSANAHTSQIEYHKVGKLMMFLLALSLADNPTKYSNWKVLETVTWTMLQNHWKTCRHLVS